MRKDRVRFDSCTLGHTVVPSMKDGVPVRVAVVRSSYLACDPPIRRASSQAYNYRTRRKDRVRFDSCPPGHSRAEYERWRSGAWLVILLFVAPVARHTIAGRGGRIVLGSILVLSGIIMVLDTAGAPLIRCADHTIARFLCGGTILVLPKKFYLLCQPCHVGPRPLFVWSLSSTQTRTRHHTHTHTYSHRSVVSKHLDRVLLDEELEGCVDCAPNSDYIYDKK